jgi:hypothetical protein
MRTRNSRRSLPGFLERGTSGMPTYNLRTGGRQYARRQVEHTSTCLSRASFLSPALFPPSCLLRLCSSMISAVAQPNPRRAQQRNDLPRSPLQFLRRIARFGPPPARKSARGGTNMSTTSMSSWHHPSCSMPPGITANSPGLMTRRSVPMRNSIFPYT